jgi:radical SAM superfamily enzyme YgiQ (UPF0313 family)
VYTACQAQALTLTSSPDFDGLPPDRYLAPVRILPISASRGCYWGRCAFCNVRYGELCHFSERRADQVAEEMIALSVKYDTRHFSLAGQALSPRMLRHLSARLIEAGCGLNWTCLAFRERRRKARVR